MKKNTKVLIAVLITLILMASAFFIVRQTQFASTFTPVYCNQYEFSCCNEKVASISSYQITDEIPFTCPDTASKCVVKSIPIDANTVFYVGNTNCQIEGNILTGSYFKCSDEVNGKTIMSPGDKLYLGGKYYPRGVNRKVTAQVEISQLQLAFCGRAGCTTGQVISSSNCVLTASIGTIFTQSGNNVGLSYTVPKDNCALSWNSGDRTICGNLEEQCDSNSDCSGHTYGNQECTARTLQTYGCRNFGLPSGVTELADGSLKGADILPGISSPSYSGVKSRCEITSSQAVQCCGDTDCGSNMFCDKTSFTCKQTAQCSVNSDCGVTTQCDYSTKMLKTPICNSARQCSYKTESVDCCLDANCPSGYTCSSDKKCIQQSIVKIACTKECCSGETEFLDKACANGKFCVKNVCTSNSCKTDSDCSGQVCIAGSCQDKEELTCDKWYQVKGVKVTSVKSWYNYIGIGSPTIVESPICETAGFVYLIIFLGFTGIVILGIVIFVISTKKNKLNKRR